MAETNTIQSIEKELIKSSKNGFIKEVVGLLHWLIIFIVYPSPFWLDWRLVTAGVLLYWLQLIVFKDCILSMAQFGNTKTSFHYHYLKRIGLKVNLEKVNFACTYIIPTFILGLAILLQVVFGYKPLVSI